MLSVVLIPLFAIVIGAVLGTHRWADTPASVTVDGGAPHRFRLLRLDPDLEVLLQYASFSFRGGACTLV